MAFKDYVFESYPKQNKVDLNTIKLRMTTNEALHFRRNVTSARHY